MVLVTQGQAFRPAATYGRLGRAGQMGDLTDTAKEVVRDVKDVLFKSPSTSTAMPITTPAPALNTFLGVSQGTLLLAGGLALGAGVLIWVLSKD